MDRGREKGAGAKEAARAGWRRGVGPGCGAGLGRGTGLARRAHSSPPSDRSRFDLQDQGREQPPTVRRAGAAGPARVFFFLRAASGRPRWQAHSRAKERGLSLSFLADRYIRPASVANPLCLLRPVSCLLWEAWRCTGPTGETPPTRTSIFLVRVANIAETAHAQTFFFLSPFTEREHAVFPGARAHAHGPLCAGTTQQACQRQTAPAEGTDASTQLRCSHAHSPKTFGPPAAGPSTHHPRPPSPFLSRPPTPPPLSHAQYTLTLPPAKRGCHLITRHVTDAAKPGLSKLRGELSCFFFFFLLSSIHQHLHSPRHKTHSQLSRPGARVHPAH
jgi:hypothetical protein